MASRIIALLALLASPTSAIVVRSEKTPSVDIYALRAQVLKSQVVLDKIAKTCKNHKTKVQDCESRVGDTLFCQLLERSHPDLAKDHCAGGAKADTAKQSAKTVPAPAEQPAKNVPAAQAVSPPVAKGSFAALKAKITSTAQFQESASGLATTMGCNFVKKSGDCASYVQEAAFCLAFAEKMSQFAGMEGEKEEAKYCSKIDEKMPALSMMQQPTNFLQVKSKRAPEDELAKEMTHDLEMNFNKIAPFGKEDTAKELQDHAAKTQDTLVDAVENAEVAEIKRAVFRALTRLRAATIKEFDTIARLETQAIDAYNDAHHYRAENPLAHLHEDEAPVETDKLKSFH
jgi:hypothetical protein